ncbi:hypothetical protein Taro_012067 [Colocasia esculenta]|uniref:Uncharacterized protein n=1 Tax=Colocasia esculenta TaxID=4460 RepID=A0A843UBX0_COLES|nr:hypothetical protein [Colocasia esculenta]
MTISSSMELGTQASSHEELLFSGRLEGRKKVLPNFSPTTKNVPEDGDATPRTRPYRASRNQLHRDGVPRRDLRGRTIPVITPFGDHGTNISSKGSVDTPYTGVDTMLQALSQKMKKWSSSVDTRPSQVDTRGKSQRIMFTDWDSVSTLDHLRSTLETSPRELFCLSGTARSTLPPSSVDTLKPRSTLTSSSVDTYPSQGVSRRGHRLRVFLFLRDIAPSKPLFYARSTPWPPSTFEYGNDSTFFPPPTHPCFLPFLSSSPSSALPLSLASMAPKQAPRRGARSKATARPIPAEEAPPTERRSKRRHDPAE